MSPSILRFGRLKLSLLALLLRKYHNLGDHREHIMDSAPVPRDRPSFQRESYGSESESQPRMVSHRSAPQAGIQTWLCKFVLALYNSGNSGLKRRLPFTLWKMENAVGLLFSPTIAQQR